MKLVTYNIQFGRGKDEVNDLERIAREVTGADIICLQEVDRFWPRSHEIDQVDWFCNRFPEFHAEYGAGVSIGADQTDNDGNVMHRKREFGNLTLSRFPIVYSRHHLLPKYSSTGSPISIQRSVLESIVDIGEHILRIMNTHLTHLSSATREPQIQRLLEIHRRALLEGEPVSGDMNGSYWELPEPLPTPPQQTIMAGDFNFEPDSDNYTTIVGPNCDYGGRISNPTLFMDARVAAGYPENEGYTSDVNQRPARLDHLFISPSLATRVADCYIDNTALGSDHDPMWLELSL